MNDIGNKIRNLRRKTSMTQEQLAERLGLSAQAVSKWENAAAMPDISLLPDLAEIFGVTIDELFDLTAAQKLRRIESRMDAEADLPQDVFREYEDFLQEQYRAGQDRQTVLRLLAHLYHHRLETYGRLAGKYAREAIQSYPNEKDCQWILQRAEGAAIWDWNIANHAKTISFYKQLTETNPDQIMPYLDLLDNLIADHRVKEAEAYLARYALLPGAKPWLVQSYEAAIALAAFDEKKADAIIEKALEDYPGRAGMLFGAAQYYASKCDYDKAIKYYEASFAADDNRKPRYSDDLEAIAIIHEIRGDLRSALDARKRILTLLTDECGFRDEAVVDEARQDIRRLEEKIGNKR